MFSPLTSYQRGILKAAKRLPSGPPPVPWKWVPTVIGGATMVGWSVEGLLVVLSNSGYGVVDPATGKTVHRDDDDEKTDRALSVERLLFTVPHTSEPIAVFGLFGGSGIRVTADGWTTETIYPWWPRARVVLFSPRGPGVKSHFDGASVIHECDGVPVHTGFSPNGKHLVVMESSALEFFSRP